MMKCNGARGNEPGWGSLGSGKEEDAGADGTTQ